MEETKLGGFVRLPQRNASKEEEFVRNLLVSYRSMILLSLIMHTQSQVLLWTVQVSDNASKITTTTSTKYLRYLQYVT